jgi:hypothetical protein
LTLWASIKFPSHQIPEGVSSPDKSKDRVRIDIVGVRESILKDDGLEGQDMGPAGLCLKQDGIEHESAQTCPN